MQKEIFQFYRSKKLQLANYTQKITFSLNSLNNTDQKFSN
jgi:hypothetical protein